MHEIEEREQDDVFYEWRDVDEDGFISVPGDWSDCADEKTRPEPGDDCICHEEV